jgi:demethylmenaquinone methyltransferase/2-methoxy-6-polyprenyl-1,4-benzoquinol methylase
MERKTVLEKRTRIINTYRKQAKRYDASGIRALEAFRMEAVKRLQLKPGDLVVDIGCGTGLNFALLEEAIGPEGRIIGIDLTDAMLDQARLRIAEQGWKNVELVQSDAAQYEFPAQVDGILSTFAFTFVPDSEQVIMNGCHALAPGRNMVVLDMAWPTGWPLWWRHLLFLFRLQVYGITGDIVQRSPWQTVWKTMERNLMDVARKQFWMGFFYIASGKQSSPTD